MVAAIRRQKLASLLILGIYVKGADSLICAVAIFRFTEDMLESGTF